MKRDSLGNNSPGSDSPDSDSLRKAEWAARIDELKSFRLLENDWDGEGSIAPAAELVDGAVALAQSLRQQRSAPQRVVVGANGTIFFEWHTPERYREIEVDSPLAGEERWIPTGSGSADVARLQWDA